MGNAVKETVNQTRACLTQVYSKPEYGHLESKLYLSTEPQPQFPLQYLTDPSKPTKADISDLYKLYDETQPCRKILLDGAAGVHTLLVAALVDYYSDDDQIWIDAAKGNLTWGNFNEGRRSAYSRFQQKYAQVNTQITSQLQGQHQFELEHRQRAAAAMQQWAAQQQQIALQQQTIAAANRPRVIHCNYFMDSATCHSN
jgi:hypothetical protein